MKTTRISFSTFICLFVSSGFEVSYISGAGASFDSGSLFSSSSTDITAFHEEDCDSVSLEDVGVESEGT